MFNQTFVDGTQRTRKPYTVVLSLVLQISALGILILIPLLYTETLPAAQLKSMLVAPPPPSPPPVPMVKAQSKPAFRQLNAQQLIAPRAIPKQLNVINEIAPVAEVGVPGSVAESGVGNSTIGDLLSAVPNSAPAPAFPAEKVKIPNGPVRIGGVVAEANLIRRVQPTYPSLAKSARVQGTVEFSAIISKEGNIEHLQLVHGHPLLVNAAKEAVLQWKYRPTLLNGQPVEVSTEVVVNFTLTQ